jgi:elongation factor 1 alpha-like protein
MDQMDTDMLALNLQDAIGATETKFVEEPPKMTLAKDKVLEDARKAVSGQGGVKPSVSIVIIGQFKNVQLSFESHIFRARRCR